MIDVDQKWKEYQERVRKKKEEEKKHRRESYR